MYTPSTRSRIATTQGILAILFWSTTVAFARSVNEQIGTFAATSCIFTVGGAIGCFYLACRKGAVDRLVRLPLRYLLGCGGLFIVAMAGVYVAVGLASSRRQVVEVGIINYLWPSFVLLFSVPILRKRARAFLFPGMAMAFAGMVLATASSGEVSLQGFAANWRTNCVPYLLAFVGAVSWGLYSNLSRLWVGDVEGGAVPVFMVLTGLVVGVFVFAWPGPGLWSVRSVGELLFMIVFPALLASWFWEAAMRKGNLLLVGVLSYFIPVLSTAVSMAYLHIRVGHWLWVACGLVVAGAVVCRRSITDGERPARDAAETHGGD